MQFSGLRGLAAAAAFAAAVSLAACGGGSTPAVASSHTRPAAGTAPAASSSDEVAACQKFHADSVDFASNVSQAGSDPSSITAAYGGFVPVVDADRHGIEGTPLNELLDTLESQLQQHANAALDGSNPSNQGVIDALNAVFARCRTLDPDENWTPSG
jgi:hypothetical protein